MANILVIGSLKHTEEGQQENLRAFVKDVGEAIVQNKHCLYTGCMNDLDELVAKSAADWLTANEIDPDNHIV